MYHQADHIEIIQFEFCISDSISFINIIFKFLFVWVLADYVFQGADLFPIADQMCDDIISMVLIYYPFNVYIMSADMGSSLH